LSDQSIEEAKSEILRLLAGITEAWRSGNVERLEKYFDDEIVLTHPDFVKSEDGRRMSVESYREFCSRVMIRKYIESDHTIRVWGDTAVAHYRFEMEYAAGGDDVLDKGHDLLVFARRKGKWLAVWRTMIPLPPDFKMAGSG
jgi:hypothetical protein